jgi:predicted RNA binding protein YcfA (HicA-like mRNA interferase family)
LTRLEKLYMRVASSTANGRFEDVVRLAEAVGFVLVRRHGSHQVFRHREKPHLRLTLQPDKGKAKAYQVNDLLSMIESEHLWRW